MEYLQGRSDGGISVYIPPKSVQVNFLCGKNYARMAIEQFYTPSPPQKKIIPLPKQISGYAPEYLVLAYAYRTCRWKILPFFLSVEEQLHPSTRYLHNSCSSLHDIVHPEFSRASTPSALWSSSAIVVILHMISEVKWFQLEPAGHESILAIILRTNWNFSIKNNRQTPLVGLIPHSAFYYWLKHWRLYRS